MTDYVKACAEGQAEFHRLAAKPHADIVLLNAIKRMIHDGRIEGAEVGFLSALIEAALPALYPT